MCPDDYILSYKIARTGTLGYRNQKTLASKTSKEFHKAGEHIKPTQMFIVYTGSETFPLGKDIVAISLTDLMGRRANR